jgi:hypothetical protein
LPLSSILIIRLLAFVSLIVCETYHNWNPVNGPIFVLAKIMKNVMASGAEVEIGGLYIRMHEKHHQKE